MTGIPRLREWDAVVLTEVPELEASTLAEFELVAPAGGAPSAWGEEAVPPTVVERLATELDAELERPWEALVVRKGPRAWSAGAVAVRGETIDLPEGLPATVLEVVRAPDGDVQALADGEPIGAAPAPLVADAVADLDRRGRERFESFVARADKVGAGGWQLTVDPL